MRPPGPSIAAIIPTLNEAANLADAIRSVRLADFDEIVVCDGGSSDGTQEIASSIRGIKVLTVPRGRGQQLAAGFEATESPIVAIVHADCRLPSEAGAAIRKITEDHAVVGGCFRLSFDQSSALMGLYGWLSRFDTPFTTFGDQVMFARRETLDRMGSMPNLPLFEDVVLRKRLRREGRFVKLSPLVRTSARRYRKHGAIRTQVLNGLMLIAFLAGCPVDRLYRLYYGADAARMPDD